MAFRKNSGKLFAPRIQVVHPFHISFKPCNPCYRAAQGNRGASSNGSSLLAFILGVQ